AAVILESAIARINEGLSQPLPSPDDPLS
ncbi:MAG TPA: Holliday junction resolvase RuvX, partial [Oceanicaulis sp.]|nr:Holliday junction resolvase RuvX [Oceanicaulis sp.]